MIVGRKTIKQSRIISKAALSNTPIVMSDLKIGCTSLTVGRKKSQSSFNEVRFDNLTSPI